MEGVKTGEAAREESSWQGAKPERRLEVLEGVEVGEGWRRLKGWRLERVGGSGGKRLEDI